MIFSSTLLHLRRIGLPVPSRQAGRYTASEVRLLLRPSASGSAERRRAVLATAAVPGVWLSYLSQRAALETGRLAERLPTVVFLYVSGRSFEEMLHHVGGWSTVGVERALDIACACIARCLNDRL